MANQRLVSIVDRAASVSAEVAERTCDLNDIYAEAKSAGFNVRAVKRHVKRKMETAKQAAERKEAELAYDLMFADLGDFGDTPLGKASA